MILLPVACWSPSSDKDDDDEGTDVPDWFDSGDADTDTDSDADSDADGDSDSDCDAIVESTFPADGAIDAYYRGAVEFELSEPDEDAEITATFEGDLSWRGTTAVYTPIEPLEPDTDHSATLDWCGGRETIEFRTSEFGEPMEDADDLVGRTFVLDLEDARILEPAGVGDLLKQYLTVDYLVGVTGVGRGTIDVIAALGREGSDPAEQDFCNVTFAASADFDDAPYFEAEAEQATLNFAGYDIDIYDMRLGGTFSADGRSIGGLAFTGLEDTRGLDQLVAEDAEEGALCELVPSFGASCEDCPDGEPYCLRIELDNAAGEELRGTTLLEIDTSGCEGCDWWGPEDVPELDEVECTGEPTSATCSVLSGISFGAIGLSLLAMRRRPR